MKGSRAQLWYKSDARGVSPDTPTHQPLSSGQQAKLCVDTYIDIYIYRYVYAYRAAWYDCQRL